MVALYRHCARRVRRLRGNDRWPGAMPSHHSHRAAGVPDLGRRQRSRQRCRECAGRQRGPCQQRQHQNRAEHAGSRVKYPSHAGSIGRARYAFNSGTASGLLQATILRHVLSNFRMNRWPRTGSIAQHRPSRTKVRRWYSTAHLPALSAVSRRAHACRPMPASTSGTARRAVPCSNPSRVTAACSAPGAIHGARRCRPIAAVAAECVRPDAPMRVLHGCADVCIPAGGTQPESGTSTTAAP